MEPARPAAGSTLREQRRRRRDAQTASDGEVSARNPAARARGGGGARAARGHVPAYLDVLLKRGVAGVELVAQEVQRTLPPARRVQRQQRLPPEGKLDRAGHGESDEALNHCEKEERGHCPGRHRGSARVLCWLGHARRVSLEHPAGSAKGHGTEHARESATGNHAARERTLVPHAATCLGAPRIPPRAHPSAVLTRRPLLASPCFKSLPSNLEF